VPRVGLVTIGQAPRTDISDDIGARLPPDVEIVEAGALDDYSSANAVESELGAQPAEPVFITKLNDGATVLVDRDAIAAEVERIVEELSDDVDAVGILCTGEFPHFDASIPVLETGALLRSWADAIAPHGTLGVLMPKPEQAAQIRAEWPDDRDIRAAAASPYETEMDVREAAAELGDVDLVLLKCMGYDYATKHAVHEATGVGTLLPRSLLTKAITEVIDVE
jgi:protein AroM